MKRFGLFALRWVALVLMAIWLGGFTFHSGVVIPTMHETMSATETGAITREVTDVLNLIGAGVVVVWWILIGLERSMGAWYWRWLRLGTHLVSTAVLVGLFALHRTLDAKLDTGAMDGFFWLHEVYLFASTVQWGANLLILGLTIAIWQDRPAQTEGR